jgi:hypothetical protein
MHRDVENDVQSCLKITVTNTNSINVCSFAFNRLQFKSMMTVSVLAYGQFTRTAGFEMEM